MIYQNDETDKSYFGGHAEILGDRLTFCLIYDII